MWQKIAYYYETELQWKNSTANPLTLFDVSVGICEPDYTYEWLEDKIIELIIGRAEYYDGMIGA